MLETALLLVAFQVTPPAQPAPPPPTGLILGRVVDAASGRPVPVAIVALQNGTMISIAEGEKRVQDIRAGGG